MKHLIKIESTPHGVLGVRNAGLDQQYCEAGEQVILKWQPDAHWGLQEAHYTDGDGNVTPIDLGNGNGVVAFMMPDKNITVGGTFKRFVLEDWTGDAAESPIFNEHIDATDQQRNTALANVSNQTANSTTGKMGYKVLDPTKTFASQVTAENTIYEIRDVFDLNGGSVTIPAGCTLKFNGGKIINGELLFQNTIIDGDANMDIDINSNSTIKNRVDPTWFCMVPNDKDFDNGIILNKVLSVFKSVVITNTNTYYFVTPIIVQGTVFLDFSCTLSYNGNTQTDISTIKFIQCNYGTIFINSISAQFSNIDFNNFGKTTSIRGVELYNSRHNKITIRTISYFNEGIRFNGDGSGCSSNIVKDITASYCNVVIRLYQDNGGWANENYFYCIKHITYSNFKKDALCFLVYGPKWEDTTNETDTYNKCNGLIIENCSIENNKYGTNDYATLFNNTSSSRIIFSRAESARNATKFIGSSFDNKVEVVGKSLMTGNIFTSENLSGSSSKIITSNTIVNNIQTVRYSENLIYKVGSNYAVKGMFLANTYGNKVSSASNLIVNENYKPTYNTNGGNMVPSFKLRSEVNENIIGIKASEDFRMFIIYETAIVNGVEQVINPSDYPSPTGVQFAINGYGVYKNQASANDIYIMIPQNIRNFYIVVYKSNAIDFSYNLTLRGIIPIMRELPISGLFVNAPIDAYPGFIYQCIDLDKSICWNGTSWVNLDGTALS